MVINLSFVDRSNYDEREGETERVVTCSAPHISLPSPATTSSLLSQNATCMRSTCVFILALAQVSPTTSSFSFSHVKSQLVPSRLYLPHLY